MSNKNYNLLICIYYYLKQNISEAPKSLENNLLYQLNKILKFISRSHKSSSSNKMHPFFIIYYFHNSLSSPFVTFIPNKKCETPCTVTRKFAYHRAGVLQLIRIIEVPLCLHISIAVHVHWEHMS